MRELMYGNEAIGRGAYDAGCAVVTGYPGTPSTEIIESLSRYRDIHVEWSTNEKVALEVAIGASIAGRRALCTMKMVGLNVASDPLMTVSYMGVRGGLVIVSADDPGMHSSQNEQDNRWFGKFGKVPVLEPGDSEEAYRFTREAFDISERFDTAVIIRSTTRISHARSIVSPGERQLPTQLSYQKEATKYVMLPANARRRKPLVLQRIRALEEFAETSPLNVLEWGDTSFGFITGGISYQYVKEAFPEASVLKLGMSYPLPRRLIQEFVSKVGKVFVVEELDPFWETEIRAMGLAVHGKDVFPEIGELSPGVIRDGVARGLGKVTSSQSTPAEPAGQMDPDPAALPARPPVLCPGCPHRGVYYVLRKLNLTVTGDIGCYTLGALPPLSSLDTTTCMGASIGHAQGMRLGLPGDKAKKVVAVIGDSTFMHSGITPLLNMTYNGIDAPVLVLDNGTTAMTGHQGHPGAGLNARHEEAPKASIEAIAAACGREPVMVVSAYDLAAVEKAVRAALELPSSVVVVRTPCVLITRERRPAPAFDPALCIECGLCLRAGCPALERQGKKPSVNAVLCTGCGICVEICPKQALKAPVDGSNGEGGEAR